MSRLTFVAWLSLDLDRSFERTPLRLTCSDAVKDVWELHLHRAFGLISIGRLVCVIDRADRSDPLLVPLFVRSGWHGSWIRLPELCDFLNRPTEASYVRLQTWELDRNGLNYEPCNRGPRLSRMA